MLKWLISFVLVLIVMIMSIKVVHAAIPDELALPSVIVCDETLRLAGVIETEAMTQPIKAQIAIAQIVAAEATSRNMDICQLTENTWFVSVYRYALAHPNSWHARQFAAPQTWAAELAREVLLGQLPPALPGYGHFDGRSHGGDEIVIGQTYFRP